MHLQQCFGFGKYKGLTLQQVYQGTANVSVNLIKSYVHCILASEDDIFAKIFPLNKIMDFEVTDNQIKTKPFKNNHSKANLEKRIEQIFSIRNDPSDRTYIDTLDNFNIKTYSLIKTPVELTGGNPDYIIWCLNKVDDFFIHSIEDLYSLDIYRFRGFKVTYIQENLYNYEVKFIIEKNILTPTLIDFNLKKRNSISFRKSADNYNHRKDDSDRDYFNAMTDGQLGNYDDFNGSSDDISDWAGR